ncbi:MAG: hypothetical protein IT460_10785 [Planctomycetes bacterium]|nr:hypothetical protein [Planctomycetota bacterium]
MAEVAAIDARKGMLLKVDGRMCRVTSWNIWKSDRRSRIQMKFKEILTGRTSELTAQPDDRFAVLDVDSLELEHSYRDGNEEVFYTKDGDERRFKAAGLEDVLVWKCDHYRGLVVDDELVAITLPPVVVATVTETEPPIKGHPSSGLKDATLDNGVKVRVSVMTAVGDKVAIDSETMEFKERVS